MTTNKKRLLETFFNYVKIDSESHFEKEMCEVLSKELKNLGLTVFEDNAGEVLNSTGNNIYAFLNGDNNYEPLLFTCHVDTVTPGKNIKPYLCDDGFIRSKGDTILGSDDKSGIAGIVEAIKTIKENNHNHRPIELAFTIREETGLMGSKHLDYSKFKSKVSLALDAGGDVGTIVTNAPGQYKLNFTVIGKKAHAGVEPEKGINAIQVASNAISNMNLLRIDEETTCNIGSFISEYATNVVAEKAIINAEVRSKDFSKLEKQVEHMISCFKDATTKFNAQLEVKKELMYKSFNINENSEVVVLAKNACEKIGVTPVIVGTGGGSDANIFNEKGIESIIIATGMENPHTTDEQIKLENLNNTADLVLAMLVI